MQNHAESCSSVKNSVAKHAEHDADQASYMLYYIFFFLIIYIYIGGWGGDSDREIVSFGCQVEFDVKSKK